MRLGADLHCDRPDPEAWEQAIRAHRLEAVVWPLDRDESTEELRDYQAVAARCGVVIAEVGAWCNPLHPDPATRAAKITRCQERLALAEAIGARCCVNVGGSAGEDWWGPHPRDLDPDRFDLLVETVREIVDAVKPQRTRYCLETMPWMHPDSAASYRRLLEAVDRPGFAVHLDVANLINSPQRFFANSALITDCFVQLGPWVRSCHAKDVRLERELTVHLREVPPGQGGLDHATLLRCLENADPDTPLIVEHVATDELDGALDHLRSIAAQIV